MEVTLWAETAGTSASSSSRRFPGHCIWTEPTEPPNVPSDWNKVVLRCFFFYTTVYNMYVYIYISLYIYISSFVYDHYIIIFCIMLYQYIIYIYIIYINAVLEVEVSILFWWFLEIWPWDKTTAFNRKPEKDKTRWNIPQESWGKFYNLFANPASESTKIMINGLNMIKWKHFSIFFEDLLI